MNGDPINLNQTETPQEANYLPGVMTGVFIWMFLGLAISAGAALLTLAWPPLTALVLGSGVGFYALLVIELVLVIVLSAALHKLAPGVAAALFFLYAMLNGITLSILLLIYGAGNVMLAFICTAGMFGFMAGYGTLTKSDLSGYRNFLMMGLVGLLLVTVVNLLLGSDTLDMLLCYAGIFIFVGLTAYDTQKIKRMLAGCTDVETAKKIRIHGALMLYLDFINIFLRLLRLLGRRGNR